MRLRFIADPNVLLALCLHAVSLTLMSERTKDALASDAAMASVHLSERREVRYPIAFEIEVSGVTRDGQPFHERTETINVSEWGCAFYSSVGLCKDDIVGVRRLFKKEERPGLKQLQAFFQVVRVERKAEGWLVGAWKLESDDVWGIDLTKLAEPDDAQLERRRQSCSEE